MADNKRYESRSFFRRLAFGVLSTLILLASLSVRTLQGAAHRQRPLVSSSLKRDSLLSSKGDTTSSSTLANKRALPDSLTAVDSLKPKGDNLLPDTLKDSLFEDTLDDVISYTAQDSMVLLGQSKSYLFGPSTVGYQDKGIEANFIRLNADSNLVYAHYVLDSLGEPMAYPKFKDGSETYEAKSMNYNFHTSKGYITGVVTQQGEGFVTAERTKKDSANIMYMAGGKYTTCDYHDHPHFYLALTKAKVKPRKDIVAGPSYLVILGVPLPIGLPFGYFPFSSHYQSGIIMPQYGEESNRGIYLRGGGYYFAFNDYVDLALTGDIYSRGSWAINARSNYRKRYKFSGGFNLGYLVTVNGYKDVAGSYTKSKDLRITWTHTQDPKANPESTFSASVNFSTSSYNHNSLSTMYNPMVSGQNTKSSTLNYSHTFTGTPWRLSASVEASQRSIDSTVMMSLPNLSVSMNRIYPFKRKKRVGSERWYEKISISYSGQFRNTISTKEDKLFKSNLIKDWSNGINHSVPISASYKILDYIDFTISANYQERWYSYKTVESYDAQGDSIRRERKYGFNRVYDFSTSASLNTTLYGFFKPWKIFGDKIQMIRHRITPRIGISYRPDFGAPHWGYWKEFSYTDASGAQRQRSYSPYQGQIFGVPGRGLSASINFGIDNNIEAKVRSKTDTVKGYKKISIIENFSISSSYNMAADSFRLSDIATSITLKLSQSLNISLAGSWDPYQWVWEPNASGTGGVARRIDKIRMLHGLGFGSLRGTGTSFSYTFNKESIKKLWRTITFQRDDEADKPQTSIGGSDRPEGGTPVQDKSMGDMAAEAEQKAPTSLYARRGSEGEYDAEGYLKLDVPWSLSVSYSLSMNRAEFDPEKNGFKYRFNQSLMFSGNIQPTKNWSLNFNASYDFERHKISNLTLGISRDLHCWSLTASAIPLGPYRSYSITIGVKSSLLRDLKWDKHDSVRPETWY